MGESQGITQFSQQHNKKPSAFPYIGGKYAIAKWVISHFPEHQIFVDVFGGAGNITIQKESSEIEVLNDINSDIVNFFRMLRDNTEELVDYLSLIPYSREEHYRFIEELSENPNEMNSIERAAYFWFVAVSCFSGVMTGGFGVALKRSPARHHLINKTPNLLFIAQRLRECVIENLSFDALIEKYDRPETMFYCDPPYIHSRRTAKKVYKSEMLDSDHEKLLDLLKNCQGKVAVSGYDNDLYNDHLSNWRKHTKEVIQNSYGLTRRSHRGARPQATEVLWIKPYKNIQKEQAFLFPIQEMKENG